MTFSGPEPEAVRSRFLAMVHVMWDVRLTCVAFPPSLKLKLNPWQDLTLAADAVGAAGAPGAHSTATVSPTVVDSAIQRAGIRSMERVYGKSGSRRRRGRDDG